MSTKMPNSWSACWRSPADSVPVAVFPQCSGLPPEHLGIWHRLGWSLGCPYLSHTSPQAPTLIPKSPRKLTSHSTYPGHKAYSTSKCLPSRCATPPHNEDHSSRTCSSKKVLSSPSQPGSQFRQPKANSCFQRLPSSCFQIESEVKKKGEW